MSLLGGGRELYRFFKRGSISTLAAIAFAALGPLAASAAAAATSTATFSTPGETQWTVPIGVYSLTQVEAIGANGGAGQSVTGASGGAGGTGAEVSVPSLAVTPGEVLYIEVGNKGAAPGGSGNGNFGVGMGGGGSGICTVAGCKQSSTILAMAGGGGGGGGAAVPQSCSTCKPPVVYGGGSGGDAGAGAGGTGAPGKDGGAGGSGQLISAQAGGGGSPDSIGKGGADGQYGNSNCGGWSLSGSGNDGSYLTGGAGDEGLEGDEAVSGGNGGGGGGGYYGGGGGGGGTVVTCDPDLGGGGAGGGGGGSYPAADAAVNTSGNGPLVTFTYPNVDATSLSAEPQVIVLNPRGEAGADTVSATLTGDGSPVEGQTITFTVGSSVLCSASTSANGTASCHPSVSGELAVLLANRYTASFAGNATSDPQYLPSTASTHAIELGL